MTTNHDSETDDEEKSIRIPVFDQRNPEAEYTRVNHPSIESVGVFEFAQYTLKMAAKGKSLIESGASLCRCPNANCHKRTPIFIHNDIGMTRCLWCERALRNNPGRCQLCERHLWDFDETYYQTCDGELCSSCYAKYSIDQAIYWYEEADNATVSQAANRANISPKSMLQHLRDAGFTHL